MGSRHRRPEHYERGYRRLPEQRLIAGEHLCDDRPAARSARSILSQALIGAQEQPMKIQGKGALVSGGASGLGAAVVTALRARGAKVASLDLQASTEAET